LIATLGNMFVGRYEKEQKGRMIEINLSLVVKSAYATLRNCITQAVFAQK